MKRLILALFSVVTVLQGFSKGIDIDEAKMVAEKFFETSGKSALTVDEAVVFQSNNEPLTYVINFKPEGWAIVSADDRAPAILGFSNTGYFDTKEIKNLPFYSWFKGYANEISSLISSKAPEVPHSSWSDIKTSKYTKAVDPVEPLIEVEWNQGAGWNEYCPADQDGPGGHAYAGCVAVAMAQCMSVYQHPTQGYGSHSYNHDTYGNQYANFGETTYEWDKMDNQGATDAVALLLYHLGVSVNMGYAADGSGAFSRSVPGAIKSYFDYSNSAEYISRSDYTDEGEWESLLIDQLSEGHPIYYSGDAGDGEAGHAFNIDGVNSNGAFHFNFGWSGSYNGYYFVTNIKPGSSDFTSNQEAVINFKPRDHAPQDITLSNNTVEEGMPPGTVVGEIIVIDETPEDTFTFEVSGPFGFVPFTEQNGNLVTTEVLDYNSQTRYEVQIKATDKTNLSVEKNLFVNVDANSAPTNISISKNKFNDTVSIGTLIGVLNTIDSDPADTFTYVFDVHENPEIGKDNDKFIISNDSLFTNYDFTDYPDEECSLYIQSSDKLDETVSKEIILSVNQTGTHTSTTENITENTLNLFPNPVTDYFQVVSGTTERVKTIKVFDINGIVKDIYPVVNNRNITIDLRNYASGIYLVHVELFSGYQKTFKVLKR